MTKQTRLHKHWAVTVRSERLMEFLRKPRWWTTDAARVDRSPYPYGVRTGAEIKTRHVSPPAPDHFYLSILSVLHRWTGFSIRWGGK